jgi:hypothetical protein
MLIKSAGILRLTPYPSPTPRSYFMPRMAVGKPSESKSSAILIIVMTKFTVSPTKF